MYGERDDVPPQSLTKVNWGERKEKERKREGKREKERGKRSGKRVSDIHLSESNQVTQSTQIWIDLKEREMGRKKYRERKGERNTERERDGRKSRILSDCKSNE